MKLGEEFLDGFSKGAGLFYGPLRGEGGGGEWNMCAERGYEKRPTLRCHSWSSSNDDDPFQLNRWNSLPPSSSLLVFLYSMTKEATKPIKLTEGRGKQFR